MPQLVVAGVASALGVASGTLGYAAIQVAVGLGFALLGKVLIGDSSKDQSQSLSFPSEMPPYRFIYGETRAVGTPLPHPVVGEYAYGVYLLNSRPSVGTPTLFLDGREIPLTGDPYDFTGAGAEPSSGDLADHLQVWIGLGDQTGPPDVYLSEAAYNATSEQLGFRSTDAGTGTTLVYIRYKAGKRDSRSTRWPNVPPNLEVEGLRTAVYDMREPSHDPDDETTWEGTSNQALCALDALRNNPFRPYDDKYLDLDLWEAAADVADETVALAAGGSEARYTIDGTLVFDGTEIEQMMAPLMAAGASTLIRVGGKLGIAPGEASDSVLTLTDMLGALQFSNMTRGRDLPTVMRTEYVSAARGYGPAELLPWDIPGVSPGEDPKVLRQRLPFTTSPYRAMRLRKIRALQARQQRMLRGVMPPEALDLVLRSGVTVSLGSPYDTEIDGAYEVEELHPLVDPLGDEGEVALRVPVTLRGTDSAIWAWSTSEEETVIDPPYDVSISAVQVPGTVSATTGNSVNGSTGATVIPRVRYEFDPSSSAGVDSYEWQVRETVGGVWGERTGSIPADTVDGNGDVFKFIRGEAGVEIDFRVRAVLDDQKKSEWVSLTGTAPVVTAALSNSTIGTPSEPTAGTVEFDVTTPNDTNVIGFEVYAGPDSDVANAAQLQAPTYVAPNTTTTVQEAGLGSGVTRYYFVRSVGDFGQVDAWSAGTSFTTA